MNPNTGPNDLSFTTAVITAALRLMQRIAEGKLTNLWVDPPEHLADIYCLDRAVNIVWLWVAQKGHEIDLSDMGPASACCAAINAALEQGYERAGVDPAASCLSLREAVVQRHPATDAADADALGPAG